MKFVECKHISLPLLFALFFLHLLSSRPSIKDTGMGPASSKRKSKNNIINNNDKNEEPLLRMYHGPEFFVEPNHLDSIDITGLFPGRLKDINSIHLEGVMHKGTWIMISDVNDTLFVAKRSKDMKTCPNAWGFIGEHFASDERLNQNVRRCLEEELGPHIVSEIQTIEELFPQPLFYKKDYPTTTADKKKKEDEKETKGQQRKDRQITYAVIVKLGKSYTDMDPSLQFANEIVNHKWITAKELQVWLSNDNDKNSQEMEFCDSEMLELMIQMNQEYLNRLTKGSN